MPDSRDELRAIKSFPSLVKYLRDELNWPIDSDDFEELTFEYDAEEFGLDSTAAAKIETIKQFRPLVTNQPWGDFLCEVRTEAVARRGAAAHSEQAGSQAA